MRVLTAYDPSAWETFAVAMLGAGAVLIGLIFVALSINLEPLLRTPWLLRRAASAITLLMSVFIASAFVIVPGQPTTLLGAELVVVGAFCTSLAALLLIRNRSEIDAPNRRHFEQATVWAIGVLVLYVVSGVSLFVGGGGGLYWLVPAMLLAIARAILESWVLLVEIKR